MRGYQMTSAFRRVAGLGGLGALVMTGACGGSQGAMGTGGAQGPVGARTPFAQEATAPPSAAPVMVTCEPHQRTLVRPALVNGVAVSQVECVSTAQAYADAAPVAPAPAVVPVQYRTRPAPAVPAPAGVYDEGTLADTRVVPVSAPSVRTIAQPVPARQVIYDDRPVRRRAPVRSTAKSAVIIGSSAGAGAGVGAVVGGKKGALIGAVLGGGGATLWDQITRRRN
jgi:hypothetical protein